MCSFSFLTGLSRFPSSRVCPLTPSAFSPSLPLCPRFLSLPLSLPPVRPPPVLSLYVSILSLSLSFSPSLPVPLSSALLPSQ